MIALKQKIIITLILDLLKSKINNCPGVQPWSGNFSHPTPCQWVHGKWRWRLGGARDKLQASIMWHPNEFPWQCSGIRYWHNSSEQLRGCDCDDNLCICLTIYSNSKAVCGDFIYLFIFFFCRISVAYIINKNSEKVKDDESAILKLRSVAPIFCRLSVLACL
jgi:hypothetical protein